MLRRFLGASLVTLAIASVLAAPSLAAPPTTGANVVSDVPIVGTVPGVGTFNGTLDIERFTTQNGQLAVVGKLTGTLTDLAGNVIGTVTNLPVTIPISATGTCQVLHLELGPIDLDLLGLVVHLDKVVLDITAESGPGNLLGNLLCGITGLLDSSAPTGVIADVLNRLLRLLG
jgi:hypothetical protein